MARQLHVDAHVRVRVDEELQDGPVAGDVQPRPRDAVHHPVLDGVRGRMLRRDAHLPHGSVDVAAHEAADGQGCARHLFGLAMMSRDAGLTPPAVLDTEAYKTLTTCEFLSTFEKL